MKSDFDFNGNFYLKFHYPHCAVNIMVDNFYILFICFVKSVIQGDMKNLFKVPLLLRDANFRKSNWILFYFSIGTFCILFSHIF